MSYVKYPFPKPMTEEGLEAHAEAFELSATIPECFTREEKQRRIQRVIELNRIAHPGPEVQG